MRRMYLFGVQAIPALERRRERAKEALAGETRVGPYWDRHRRNAASEIAFLDRAIAHLQANPEFRGFYTAPDVSAHEGGQSLSGEGFEDWSGGDAAALPGLRLVGAAAKAAPAKLAGAGVLVVVAIALILWLLLRGGS